MDSFLGINGEYVLAGFAGGFIHAVRMKKARPRDVVNAVITAGIMANYCSTYVAHLLGTTSITSAFFAGLAANAIYHGVVDYFDKRSFKDR